MKELTILGKDIPVALLAAVVVIAGVGATAGTALSGNISGEGTTDVEQSLLVEDDFSSNNGVVQVSDDRASFEAGLELFQGDEVTLDVPVNNSASEELASRLVVEADDPLHIDVVGNGDLTVQRVGPNEFILNADPDTNDLDVEISAPNDIKPGFYEFDFTLQPVSVGE
jgi:hypothetical protein